MMIPRYYQQDAHDAVVAHWKKSLTPCVADIATGGGKSLIISMLAKTLFDLSGGKRVLCLAPSKELVAQNAEKYKAIGEECSIYSASISKSLRHKVVFASELTFKSVVDRIGHEFAGVIVDEAHRTTNTIKDIIEKMQKANPSLRVCGLTATPYRLGDGYIYAVDDKDRPMPEGKARNTFYTKLVYRIGADELIEQGYLTPLSIGSINSKAYDTSGLKLQANHKFKQSDLEKTFEGWGRETSEIVADVVAQSVGKMGVMFFAATVNHAKEIMASLPPENSMMIGGNVNMKKTERDALVAAFKEQKYKYLVNVATMTTGVDFTHVDVIAVLRKTESASLFQQIIGRALRLHEDKHEALLLDYAGNVNDFAPDGDIFNPKVEAARESESVEMEITCPDCGGKNLFSARHNPEEYKISKDGYFVDNDGNAILTDDDKPYPAHFGRRCANLIPPRLEERCNYYWSHKECEECEHKNDIAARYCSACKNELIDPNQKLVLAHAVHKRSPREMQCDLVEHMFCSERTSKAGNKTLVVEFQTPYRVFTVYIMLEPKNEWQATLRDNFMRTTKNGTVAPRTVSYKKKDDFYLLLGMNRPTDDEVLQSEIQSLN